MRSNCVRIAPPFMEATDTSRLVCVVAVVVVSYQEYSHTREGYPGPWLGGASSRQPHPQPLVKIKESTGRSDVTPNLYLFACFLSFRGGEERAAPSLHFLLIWEGVRGRRRTQASRQASRCPKKRTACRHGARTTPSPPLSAAWAHRARACTSARARQLPGPTP